MVPFDDLANCGLRNRRDTCLSTVGIKQHFEFLFAKAPIFTTVLAYELYNALIVVHPPNPTRPGAVRLKCPDPPLASTQPFAPYMDHLPIRPKGLFCRRIAILLVKSNDLHPLLRYFALIKPSKTSQHTLQPPPTFDPAEDRICPGVMIHQTSTSKMYRNFFSIGND
jgi:hypothetical protein